MAKVPSQATVLTITEEYPGADAYRIAYRVTYRATYCGLERRIRRSFVVAQQPDLHERALRYALTAIECIDRRNQSSPR